MDDYFFNEIKSHPSRGPCPVKDGKAQETFVSTLLALRSYRHQFSVLPKSEDETLAFSPAISPASSFVKAKHFLPRSFRDAPIR